MGLELKGLFWCDEWKTSTPSFLLHTINTFITLPYSHSSPHVLSRNRLIHLSLAILSKKPTPLFFSS